MKSLADLKRELTLDRKLVLKYQCGKVVNIPREVAKIQSNGLYLKRPDHPKNSFLEYPKASLLDFTGHTFKIFERGLRPLTTREQEIKAGYEKIRNKKQEEIDILSDGSSSFWTQQSYYKQHDAEYLIGHTSQRGMKFDYNTGLVYDDNIQGDLVLEYELI